ncbi:haloalkane dehalogenase [Caulobacter sp. BP25]|uniref:haloalkane dehalogenase n=1 Tax=Caulobacter sp. BP25 TaxID=2048900 RepID=UPI000C12B342|nr:haloalkane dehalogenase [Caulobacter sp. BP25]PHY20438.1 haloalkane dehalogenase [Caulobacter sp. BP25]
MDVLRTPDERFEGLADWTYAPGYTEITDANGTRLRIHHVDEGPRDQRPILLMHGEPSWAYLYRKIIADLAGRGRRAVAPDLVGFGRSDKPASRTDYTYERHVAWMSDWLVRNDLKDIVLFCQDWGGLIGLRLVAAFPERFAAVVVSNTGMPVGYGKTEGFEAWLNFSQNVPEMPIGFILNGGTARDLSDAERAAYDAPFPDERYKEGARQFPALVPITLEHASVAENEAAWKVLERFDKPFLTAFSDGDPITRGGEAIFQARVPATQKSKHVTLKGGHFIQEDAPAEIAALLDELVASLPQPEMVA